MELLQKNQINFQSGLSRYIAHMANVADLYNVLIEHAAGKPDKIIRIQEDNLISRALLLFGPQIDASHTKIRLQDLYDVAVHPKSGAIIVANRGMTLSSKTQRYGTPYAVRYVTAAIYMPQLGVEIANIGIVGDIYNREFILRGESACASSFLFGSQSCNCVYQWQCMQEVAAALNSAEASELSEEWLTEQFTFIKGKHIPKKPGIGFLMIHYDTQNGMGSGYTENVFSMDLETRAILRHGGELTAKEQFGLSIKEAFEAMNLPLDPRRAGDAAGYQITPILLDFLGVNQHPILLSNNPHKIRVLEDMGYYPQRLKVVGEVNEKGSKIAKERQKDFGHKDIGSELVTFEQEFQRLKQQIEGMFNTVN